MSEEKEVVVKSDELVTESNTVINVESNIVNTDTADKDTSDKDTGDKNIDIENNIDKSFQELSTNEDKEDNKEQILQELPQKVLFKEMDEIIRNSYNYRESNNSTICDILAVYFKGQKILYTEAKTVCEQRLNYLMLPSIFITALCSVLNLVLKDYYFGPIITSSLNGFTVFILALINYLKLDAKSEAHRTSAFNFDKLESNLEIHSAKILFISGASKELAKLIDDIEKEFNKIKANNHFILPEIIRYSYPNLYNMNVFSEVKKIQNNEMILINRLKDTVNDILTIKSKQLLTAVDQVKIENMEIMQKKLVEQIINIKNDYLIIDKKFDEELEIHRDNIKRSWQPCKWLKS